MRRVPVERPDSGAKETLGVEEVLRVVGITKRFGDQVVLDGVDLRLHTGEDLAILGKSGTGKSVLLKIIAGLLEPDAGELFLWGRSMTGLGEEEWLPFRRRMGMVFQAGALFDSMSVLENVAFPLRERKIRDEIEIQRIVEERLEWVGLPGVGERAPSELSGGMRRRVALARTLAGNPEFILYDEPTTGLDPVTGRMIAQLMHDLDRKLNTTSILVTHDIECARKVSNRWAYLSQGRILADGPPEALLASPLRELQEFLLPPAPA